MNNKGFSDNSTIVETPNDASIIEKPLKSKENQTKKVDINVLKARAQEIQNKENRINIFIFFFLLVIVGIVGIYLSI